MNYFPDPFTSTNTKTHTYALFPFHMMQAATPTINRLLPLNQMSKALTLRCASMTHPMCLPFFWAFKSSSTKPSSCDQRVSNRHESHYCMHEFDLMHQHAHAQALS